MKRKVPEIAPDDTCEVALMTPRRYASQIHRIAVDLSSAALKLRALAAYVDYAKLEEVALGIDADAANLGRISGKILTGEIAIVAGRDEAAGRDRYPLFEPRLNGRADHSRKPKSLPEPKAPDPESWRLTPVSELPLTGRAKDELVLAGIVSAGQLDQWLARQSGPDREIYRNQQPDARLEARIAAVREVLGRLRDPAPPEPPAESPRTAPKRRKGRNGPVDEGTPEGNEAAPKAPLEGARRRAIRDRGSSRKAVKA